MKIFLFDRAENILGKGENASYQHFLLFPECFQKLSSLGSLKVGIVLTLYHALQTSNTPQKTFENILGKEDNAGNQHFLLFPQCLLPYLEQISSFWLPFL